jgi:hypothetical protein
LRSSLLCGLHGAAGTLFKRDMSLIFAKTAFVLESKMVAVHVFLCGKVVPRIKE